MMLLTARAKQKQAWKMRVHASVCQSVLLIFLSREASVFGGSIKLQISWTVDHLDWLQSCCMLKLCVQHYVSIVPFSELISWNFDKRPMIGERQTTPMTIIQKRWRKWNPFSYFFTIIVIFLNRKMWKYLRCSCGMLAALMFQLFVLQVKFIYNECTGIVTAPHLLH